MQEGGLNYPSGLSRAKTLERLSGAWEGSLPGDALAHKTLPAFAAPASQPARRGVRMRCRGAAAEPAAAEARAAPGSLPRGWDGSSWSEKSPAPRGPAGVRAGGPGEGARTARGERVTQLGTAVAPGTGGTGATAAVPRSGAAGTARLPHFSSPQFGVLRVERQAAPKSLIFLRLPPLPSLSQQRELNLMLLVRQCLAGCAALQADGETN